MNAYSKHRGRVRLAVVFLAVVAGCLSDDDSTNPSIVPIDASRDASSIPDGAPADSTVTDAATPDAPEGDAASDAAADTATDAGADAALGWTLTQVSVGPGGIEPDENSSYPIISADGRFVAFTSKASNLVANDNNDDLDVFVYDRQTPLGTLERVNVSTAGAEAIGESQLMGISADGRFVLYTSTANNLVAGDTNGISDHFVRDRLNNTTERVSLTSTGGQTLGGTFGNVFARMSHDGRFVVFQSDSTNVVPGDTNGSPDIFLRDRTANTTVLMSSAPDGGAASGLNVGTEPNISANGRFVTFASLSNQIVTGDTNGATDIFLRDIEAGVTSRVSLAADGGQANNHSFFNRATDDGRYVVALTRASNLIPGDDNDEDDLVMFDRNTGAVANLSRFSDGGPATAKSDRFEMTSDAGVVAFEYCGELTTEPWGGFCEAFVRDVAAQTVTRISSPPGIAGDGGADFVGIAESGKVAVFTSRARNIVSPPQTTFWANVYIAVRQ